MLESHTAILALVKETKGALRYGVRPSDRERLPISDIYLRKDRAFPTLPEDSTEWPAQIRVTVEVLP